MLMLQIQLCIQDPKYCNTNAMFGKYNLHTTFLIGAEYENMIADLARSETEHTGMPAKRPFFGVLCSIK